MMESQRDSVERKAQLAQKILSSLPPPDSQYKTKGMFKKAVKAQQLIQSLAPPTAIEQSTHPSRQDMAQIARKVLSTQCEPRKSCVNPPSISRSMGSDGSSSQTSSRRSRPGDHDPRYQQPSRQQSFQAQQQQQQQRRRSADEDLYEDMPTPVATQVKSSNTAAWLMSAPTPRESANPDGEVLLADSVLEDDDEDLYEDRPSPSKQNFTTVQQHGTPTEPSLSSIPSTAGRGYPPNAQAVDPYNRQMTLPHQQAFTPASASPQWETGGAMYSISVPASAPAYTPSLDRSASGRSFDATHSPLMMPALAPAYTPSPDRSGSGRTHDAIRTPGAVLDQGVPSHQSVHGSSCRGDYSHAMAQSHMPVSPPQQPFYHPEVPPAREEPPLMRSSTMSGSFQRQQSFASDVSGGSRGSGHAEPRARRSQTLQPGHGTLPPHTVSNQHPQDSGTYYEGLRDGPRERPKGGSISFSDAASVVSGFSVSSSLSSSSSYSMRSTSSAGSASSARSRNRHERNPSSSNHGSGVPPVPRSSSGRQQAPNKQPPVGLPRSASEDSKHVVSKQQQAKGSSSRTGGEAAYTKSTSLPTNLSRSMSQKTGDSPSQSGKLQRRNSSAVRASGSDSASAKLSSQPSLARNSTMTKKQPATQEGKAAKGLQRCNTSTGPVSSKGSIKRVYLS